jgi:hypothetical protein
MKPNLNAGALARILLTLLIALLLSACAPKLTVRAEADPSVDFDQYRTWNFFPQLGIEGGNNSPVFGEHFRSAIEREMLERGYRQAEQPDLLVNVSLRGDDRVRMSAHTRPYLTGTYYEGVGGASYGSALGVGIGIGTQSTEYSEASVFIDLVDNRADRMVWQGVAVAQVDDKVAQSLRDAIYTATNRIFEKYPHRAGS